MKQLLLLTAMAITCVLAATANVVIARTIGINFFTMKVWFVIPIGAALVGMLGASGAILAARYFRIVPKILDAAFMVIIAAATMILIYYLDYATLVLDDGRRASDLIDFGSYVDLVLTKSHMRVGRAGHDTGEVGQLGYARAAIESAGFLIGGAATFLFISGMARCSDCESYLRKLKTKKTKELTFDETGLRHGGEGRFHRFIRLSHRDLPNSHPSKMRIVRNCIAQNRATTDAAIAVSGTAGMGNQGVEGLPHKAGPDERRLWRGIAHDRQKSELLNLASILPLIDNCGSEFPTMGVLLLW